MKRSSIGTIRLLASLFVVAALVAGSQLSAQPYHPAEVGFVALSPNGQVGGGIIPASCSSGVFDATDQVGCTSPPNSCGQTNTGVTTDCSGTCSVGTPSNSGCPQPPIITICQGASCGTPRPVIIGTVVTITWSCPSPNISSTNSFNGSTAASGSANVTVNASTTYTVHCTQTGTQGSVSATAINPQLSLAANPQKVQSGGTSTLTWSATSVQSCTLTGPGVSASATADVNGNISSRNTTTGAITASNTYTLTCQTSAGTIPPVTVIVSPIPNVIEI